jgi:hypothetical protein
MLKMIFYQKNYFNYQKITTFSREILNSGLGRENDNKVIRLVFQLDKPIWIMISS